MTSQASKKIPILPDDQIPSDVLSLLKQYPRINVYTVLAHSPSVCKPWIEMINGIYASGFSARLREVALVRIGAVTKAEYELHQHHFIALKNGVTEEEVQAIIHEASVTSLDEEGNLICRAVDELHKRFSLSDETFDELTNHFSTKDIVSLGVAVAMYFAVAILANFCRLEIEPSNPLKDFQGFKED